MPLLVLWLWLETGAGQRPTGYPFPLMSDVHASREALSEGGALASHLDAFVPRPAQLHLTAAIADALQQRDLLLAEAGTGTGKTFAYLVPVLLSGLRTIISTGTRALQDQLYHRDLPRVRQALGVGLRSALLKGRANYLCRYRLQQARGEPRFSSPEQAAQFQRILAWSVARSSVTSPSWRAWPMTRRCCQWSPPLSTIAWAPIAHSGTTASWCAHGSVRRPPTWWWSTTTCCWPIWH